jgi:hypothetical protein
VGSIPLKSLFFKKFFFNFDFLIIHVNKAILHPRFYLTLWSLAVMANYFANGKAHTMAFPK